MEARNIVVLGAGYAAVMAVNRILTAPPRAGRPPINVTVVNPTADFVPRIRLHEVAAGRVNPVTVALTQVLHPQARILVGEALHIAPHRVAGDGWDLAYDILVYAVGSRTRTDLPGVREFTHQIDNLDAAMQTRHAVAALPAGARVVVVGGGLTGIEMAAELAEQRPDLRLELRSTRPVATQMSPRGATLLTTTLRKLGVAIRTGARVVAVQPGHLLDAQNQAHTFDLCIWAATMTAPTLAADSGLAVDANGRLIVDEALRHPDLPQIIGAGDAAAPPASVAGHLRMSCAAALPLGIHAAQTVIATLDCTTPAPLSVGFVVQSVSLGRRRGLVQLVAADDTPRPLAFAGRFAATIKEQVSSYTLAVLRKERHRPSYWYPNGPQQLTTDETI